MAEFCRHKGKSGEDRREARMNNGRETMVSVVIPGYRCEATICQAVDSALDQNVPLEVLVVDDCSPDNLTQVMAAYEQDNRVRYIRNETNLGAAKSRNKGVVLASGEYIAFLDADDYWTKDKLSKQLALMEKENAVLCCTARELMRPDGTLTGHVIPVKEAITYRELLKHNSVNCSSVVMRRDVALEFPMEHEDSHEDYITWLRVLQKYHQAVGVNEPLLKYRLSNSGKSGNKFHSAGMTFRVYRYMGFGIVKSCICFASYAFHGVKKYMMSGR